MTARLALPGGKHALVLRTFAQPLELRTARTLLRNWRDSDLPAWVAMNADPAVRRYFSSIQSEDEALAEAARIRANIARRGWGVWALEVPGTLEFAGFVGLHVSTFEALFMPVVEMGWRLRREAWGQGYASEAAAAAAAFAFAELNLPEVVAFTTTTNQPSRRVMQRIGMRHDSADDFEHPGLAPGHPMRRHVLYRLTQAHLLAA
jgi:RimJ/RimL family protein N-acetyltransferase